MVFKPALGKQNKQDHALHLRLWTEYKAIWALLKCDWAVPHPHPAPEATYNEAMPQWYFDDATCQWKLWDGSPPSQSQSSSTSSTPRRPSTRSHGQSTPALDLAHVRRSAKADLVAKLSRSFIRVWKAAFNESTHVYPHILLEHIPDFIRRLPVDPIKIQTQGLESHQGKVKKVARETTNKRKPGGKGTGLKRAQQTFLAVAAERVSGQVLQCTQSDAEIQQEVSAKHAVQVKRRVYEQNVKRAACSFLPAPA
jgi:hypothetical protein